MLGPRYGYPGLIARLSLAPSEGGLDAFAVGFGHEVGAQRVSAFDSGLLTKQTARQGGTLFGELVHLWLYDSLAETADKVNRRALLLFRDDHEDPHDDRLWTLLKQTLWLPVLESWQAVVVQQFRDNEWVRPMVGYGMHAWYVDLSAVDTIEAAFTSWLRDGSCQPIDHDTPLAIFGMAFFERLFEGAGESSFQPCRAVRDKPDRIRKTGGHSAESISSTLNRAVVPGIGMA